MDKERRNELTWPTGRNFSLTQEELKQGYHFCYDWDYLVVGPEHKDEWSCCTCPIRKEIEKNERA